MYLCMCLFIYILGEPAQVRLLRGHVQPDLPQRRVCPLQPQAAIRREAHLCKQDDQNERYSIFPS